MRAALLAVILRHCCGDRDKHDTFTPSCVGIAGRCDGKRHQLQSDHREIS